MGLEGSIHKYQWVVQVSVEFFQRNHKDELVDVLEIDVDLVYKDLFYLVFMKK